MVFGSRANSCCNSVLISHFFLFLFFLSSLFYTPFSFIFGLTLASFSRNPYLTTLKFNSHKVEISLHSYVKKGIRPFSTFLRKKKALDHSFSLAFLSAWKPAAKVITILWLVNGAMMHNKVQSASGSMPIGCKWYADRTWKRWIGILVQLKKKYKGSNRLSIVVLLCCGVSVTRKAGQQFFCCLNSNYCSVILE